MEKERLIRVTAPHFCAGLIIKHGKVVEAAPILRKQYMGKSYEFVKKHLNCYEMNKSVRILVCGGRHYNSSDLYDFLDKYVRPLSKKKNVIIVHGCAYGADTMAGEWAKARNIQTDEYPADWDKHGRKAGHIRNQEMLDSGVNLVIACPGGRGTENMILIATNTAVPVVRVITPQ